MRKTLDELELQNGKVITKYGKKEFSGTIVSTYPTGEVRTETVVESGRQLDSTTYDQSGKILSRVESPLATKERSFGYGDVSHAYNNYNKERQENLLPHLLMILSIVSSVVIIFLIKSMVSGKKG